MPEKSTEKSLATCPACGKRVAYGPQLAGKKVKCPKCSAPFTLGAAASAPATPKPPAPSVPDAPGPDTGDYDLAPAAAQPSAPRRPAPAAPPAPRNAPKQAPGNSTRELLDRTGQMAARGNLKGAAGGLIIVAIVSVFRGVRDPRIAGPVRVIRRIILFGFLGFLLLIAALYYFGPWILGHRRSAAPPPVVMPPPPMMQPPPTMQPPPNAPPRPTYESMVARFGADHVVRMTVTGTNDVPAITATLQQEGLHNWLINTSGNGVVVTLGIPEIDFDTWIKSIHFGSVTASDRDAHTLTVAWHAADTEPKP